MCADPFGVYLRALQMITSHTDVVGSLLRPQSLLAAQEALSADRLSRSEFKSIEDRAVDEAVALQEGAGLEVLTDGEMRRLSFQSQMTQAVDGFGEWYIDACRWCFWHGARQRLAPPCVPRDGCSGRTPWSFSTI